jgi:hypothetical protein
MIRNKMTSPTNNIEKWKREEKKGCMTTIEKMTTTR